jgi:hypothetical protein
MRSNFKASFLIGLFAAVTQIGCTSQQVDERNAKPTTMNSAPSQVLWSDLGNSVQVIGPLGEPMGKLMKIEGRVLSERERPNTYWAINIAQNLFEVESIGGKPTSVPRPLIDVRTPDRSKLSGGVPMAIIGFQDGGFVGQPTGAQKYQIAQQQGYGFDVYFQQIASEDPKVFP